VTCLGSKSRSFDIPREASTPRLRLIRRLTCRRCPKSFQILYRKRIFCSLFVRRFSRTLWADPYAFVPMLAGDKNKHCPVGEW